MKHAPLTNPFLRAFAWFTAGATLLLICSGGMVTSKGVGLAVPDWPTTFGYNMFFFPVSKWVGGIFFEHTHRLIASVVGFLTIILAVWLAFFSPAERWIKKLGWASLGMVVLQGVLGGLRVTLMKDQIGIFHACVAQAFFAMLVLIALALSPVWRRLAPAAGRIPARAAILISVVTFVQLALGATMRHQHRDLAITDFPLAYGQVVPKTDAAAIARINETRERVALSEVTPAQIWLQMAHRFGAALIGTLVIGFWLLVRRRRLAQTSLGTLSKFWLVLIVVQIALGGWTIWSNKAADIATAHVAVGAVTFVTGVAISAIALRLQWLARPLPSAPTRAPLAEASVA
ncbi:MAG: COX15/CtaA family protein [Chthoniobacterales bacterium]|nr:COX15/CtaA family protein [Chthoniobacterales bacterium]